MVEIKLEFGKYYVVEIAFFDNNPIHRAIMCSYRTHHKGASADFMGSGYEGVLSRNIEDLAYLRVIEPIESLNSRYKNYYKLPTEMNNSPYRRKSHA